MIFNSSGKTDIGKKRETNQDFFVIDRVSEEYLLMVVCDGMGGAVGGSEASSIAATAFLEYVKNNINSAECKSALLLEAQNYANGAVCDKAESVSELDGMGTTLVAALYDGKTYTLLWVGDSRIYAITNDGIRQLSHDHSFVQSLIDNGSISLEEAKYHPNRNIITKAIGTDRGIEGDVSEMSDENLEGLLLCSDGLCGYVDEETISQICVSEKDTSRCVDALVDKANDEGGHDNITVIVHRKQNA